MSLKINWKLCLVADAEAAGERNILTLIQEAIEGGVTLVQLRAKKLSIRKFLEISIEASKLLKREDIPLIINDRIDIALACQSVGVHLGQEDLPLSFAQKILGKKKLIGISVNTEEEALEAEKAGADYLGVGPIFPTLSKTDLKPLLGLDGLRRIREKIEIPILAIGGINKKNAREVIKAGADGVAVISAIMGAEDIRKATRELREAISKES
jgi:thiamine-phosphate pyrophosphorylase